MRNKCLWAMHFAEGAAACVCCKGQLPTSPWPCPRDILSQACIHPPPPRRRALPCLALPCTTAAQLALPMRATTRPPAQHWRGRLWLCVRVLHAPAGRAVADAAAGRCGSHGLRGAGGPGLSRSRRAPAQWLRYVSRTASVCVCVWGGGLLRGVLAPGELPDVLRALACRVSRVRKWVWGGAA